jgi:hypothetical protein
VEKLELPDDVSIVDNRTILLGILSKGHNHSMNAFIETECVHPIKFTTLTKKVRLVILARRNAPHRTILTGPN